MTKIGLISDTHGYIDDRIVHHLGDRDIVLHAGDIGNYEVCRQLEALTVFYAVYGNIDDGEIRYQYPEEVNIETEGLKIFMIHIGGYPGKYKKGIKSRLKALQPDIFICGHSHILKVMPDKELGLLHINPGAAGKTGFHKQRTLIKFDIEKGQAHNLRVVELGKK